MLNRAYADFENPLFKYTTEKVLEHYTYPSTLIHRMINGFTKKNLDHIWNITPRPLFYTSNQDQKSLEIQTIYAKYTPTIETCRQTIRDTLVEAQKEAFDVLNRPPTQPTQNLPPTQPS